MNCPECQDLLQRRLDGAAPAPDAALERHLADCARCRERHQAARRLLEGLQALPQPVPPANFAAAILLMLLAGYLNRPNPTDGKPEPGPIADSRKEPVPPVPEKKKEEAPPSLAELSGRLADKTLDQAKVLWTAANPVEGMPMPVGELPNVADLDPAAQPLRQAKQEMNEGLQAVGPSARRAFGYFARRLALARIPPGP